MDEAIGLQMKKSGAWGQAGRLLFRTWISPFNSRPLPSSADYQKVWGSVEAGKPRGGWDQAIQTGEVPKAKIPEGYVYHSLSMNGSCGISQERIFFSKVSGPQFAAEASQNRQGLNSQLPG